MVRVEEQRERLGPLIAGEVVEALDLGLGGAVDEEAEDVVDDEGIVDGLGDLVGLAHDDHAGALFGVEEAFHAGHGDGLMLGDVFAVQRLRWGRS